MYVDLDLDLSEPPECRWCQVLKTRQQVTNKTIMTTS